MPSQGRNSALIFVPIDANMSHGWSPAVCDPDRVAAVRLTWKPYMHDPRLPHLLARVTAPTRIIWGRQDRIIPAECGSLYQQAIPGADLVVLDQCGHAPQVEKPDEFVRLALDFLP
jgi:pimeloyl-ACP methyl ester carboxylesterase